MSDDVSTARVLIVDDSEDNLHFMSRALRKAGFPEPLRVSNPFEAAQAYLSFQPEVVILDFKLPPVDGFHVLAEIHRLVPEEDMAPVIMITGDAPEEVKRRALEMGVADFVLRQADLTEVVLRTRNFLHARRLFLEVNRQKDRLEDIVRERTRELEQAQREILERLALAAEFRDDQTGEHTRRVAHLSAEIAAAMKQPEDFVRAIGSAALLHDLGKIGIPDRILRKPATLNLHEYEELKQHTEIGARVLEGCTEPVLRMARDIALGHHEHWDGSGYPRGVRGEDIPLAARIVAVADAYDAITNARPYKPAFNASDALSRIASKSGTQFDPDVVKGFERAMARSRRMMA